MMKLLRKIVMVALIFGMKHGPVWLKLAIREEFIYADLYRYSRAKKSQND